ncbi:actin cross-linking protein, partial [Thalictrum thalictroides]
MEFFNKSKAVRLRSHLDKYLCADEDQIKVRQSRNDSSKRVIWIVELVEENSHLIRLKSCTGQYLTATEDPFFFGMTGKKVVQTNSDSASLIEWEPIRDGFQVKLRTKGGSLLRANGATYPWRNSITHDMPHGSTTHNWVLWDVILVDSSQFDGSFKDFESQLSRFSSTLSEDYNMDSPTSPWSLESVQSPMRLSTQ